MDITIPAIKIANAPLNPANDSRGVSETSGGFRQRVGSANELNIHILINPASCILIILFYLRKSIFCSIKEKYINKNHYPTFY